MKNLLYLLMGLFATTGFAQKTAEIITKVWENEAMTSMVKPAPLPFYSDYDVVFCHLNLHLERNTVYIEGNVLTKAISRKQGLPVYTCELIPGLVVDSVVYNGISAVYDHTGDTLTVTLSPAPDLGQFFSVTVFYHGLPPTGGFFTGINSLVSTVWGNEVTWTLSQPFNAKQWWPCKQDLADKIDSVYFFITTDSSNKAGSNGVLTAVTPVPGGKLRYEWKTRHPIDYYLISAAVADYQDYSIYAHLPGATDSLLVQNYIYDTPGCLAFYKADLDRTCQFLELFSQLFGPYPFAGEKYGHCQVQLGGGMEHQTMGTLGAFNFDLNCHELSHQWFGDYVTCATWSDIWVNEGFATYAQYLTMQYMIGQAEADTFIMNVQQYVMTQPGGSVYIPPGQAGNEGRIFDGRLSYNKGAAILHTLRGELNDDTLFFNLLKTYIQLYGDSLATGSDFINLAESVGGLNLDDFSDQWYVGEGYPIVDILWSQQADTLVMTLSQTSSSIITPLFRMDLEVRLLSLQGDTIVRFVFDNNVQQVKIPVSKTIINLQVDPNHWLIMQVSSINHIEEPGLPDNILFYPNPFISDIRYLINDIRPGQPFLTIMDITGREILTTTLNNSTGTIGLSMLSAGVYLVQITYGQRSVTRKMVKN
ncbi:MAG: M1 family aminopeptidase [Bacteroidetes bacterium]|nr:M1 family aminopeptidase [Bacteroidota bacterium]